MTHKDLHQTKNYIRSLLTKGRYNFIAAIRLAADTKDDDFMDNGLAAILEYADRVKEDLDDVVSRKTYLSGTMKKTDLEISLVRCEMNDMLELTQEADNNHAYLSGYDEIMWNEQIQEWVELEIGDQC